MEPICNEIMIESVEIDLLVTEGLADKSKKTFAAVIKKIKEFIRKVVTYIKSKLANKIKAVDKNIKKAKANKTETETLEEPITLANTKILNELLKSVELMLKHVKEISIAYDTDSFDELYDTLTNKYDNLMSLYEKYKDDIDETYPKITSSMYVDYGAINVKCNDVANDLMIRISLFEDTLKVLGNSTDEYTTKKMKLVSKTQAVITKAITITDFVTNSCNRSINTLYGR